MWIPPDIRPDSGYPVKPISGTEYPANWISGTTLDKSHFHTHSFMSFRSLLPNTKLCKKLWQTRLASQIQTFIWIFNLYWDRGGGQICPLGVKLVLPWFPILLLFSHVHHDLSLFNSIYSLFPHFSPSSRERNFKKGTFCSLRVWMKKNHK